MLKKLVLIKNIGRFKNCNATGDVSLKRYSLIFAENGRGKTTLCSILRSLQSGDAAHILGRTTLGVADPPQVKVLTDTNAMVFDKTAWDGTVPVIAIFDSTFVAENVFAGDYVDIDHKRNLYRVIVGQDGVLLAQQVEDLDTASRAKASEIKDKAVPIQVRLPKGITIENYLAIPEDTEIGTKIAAKEAELVAVRQANQIGTRPPLAALTPPALPVGLESLLATTVDDIAGDAEERVSKHLAAHEMQEHGEIWLSEGLTYASGGTCPLCGQPLAAAAQLLEAYKAHFSAAYKELRVAIAKMRQAIEAALGDKEIGLFERAVDQNAVGIEFWSIFCEISVPARPTGAQEALVRLRSEALRLLDRKASAPLNQLSLDSAFGDAVTSTAALTQELEFYNQAIILANSSISAKKTATAASDINTVETALARLKLVRTRHEPDATKECEDYRTALIEKKQIENKKAVAKKKLDTHATTVISRYEQAINRFLENFNAGFRIANTKHAYPGGVASSSYQVLINSTPVELGDDKTPLGKPSFRNTLSSGDRSTLALAFFLAQLEQDPARASKIVVFDDPFTSQDSFRKDCTVHKIRKCGQTSAQVIVLSHDVGFLKRIWDRLDKEPDQRRSLELARIGLSNTTVCEWDIEKASQDQFKSDRLALGQYYHSSEGNPRDVVQKIRPVLETYARYVSGGLIADSDTLGSIVAKVRNAGPTQALFELSDELEELNDYTKRYHHGENLNAAVEPIADGELHGYVRRTLELTGGC